MSLKGAVACIKNNKHFLVTSHLNLEGDALGSEIAFYRLLEKMGKYAVIVNEDDLPYEYSFLGSKARIIKFKRDLKGIKFDCFAILDCSNLKRCGEVGTLNKRDKPVLNIDHHISNESFGNINWVDPAASSTAEMIYKLYKRLGVSVDKEAALCLYVGILTDTGSFRYPNTTSRAHKIVSELLRYKFDLAKVYQNVYENIPFPEMQLLISILPHLKLQNEGKVAWLQIRQGLLKAKKSSFDLSEYILGFARAIKGVEVVVLFKENLGAKDEIRVNLRSQGKVDVNRIARLFGGGGHKTASGATVHGKIEEVRRKVLAKIRESLG